MLLHYRGKLESKFGENYIVLLNTCFILLALTRWNFTDLYIFFTAEKKKKIINKTTTNWKNFFRSSLELFMRAAQFASVSCCACTCTSPPKAFQLHCRCFFMKRTTDDLGMPVLHDISRTVLWVWSWSSWIRPYHSCGQCFHPCGYFAVCRCLTSVHCPVSLNFSSNLLLLLFIHPLRGNSFLNCFALDPFNWYNFIRILSSSLKTIFTNNAVTYDVWDDVIAKLNSKKSWSCN